MPVFERDPEHITSACPSPIWYGIHSSLGPWARVSSSATDVVDMFGSSDPGRTQGRSKSAWESDSPCVSGGTAPTEEGTHYSGRTLRLAMLSTTEAVPIFEIQLKAATSNASLDQRRLEDDRQLLHPQELPEAPVQPPTWNSFAVDAPHRNERSIHPR